MEDLLASIRRAIRDEDQAATLGERRPVELRAERQESRLPGMATPVQSAADDIKLLRDKINSELARAEMPPRAAVPAAAAPKSFSSLFRAPQPVARPAPLRQPQAVRAAPAPESLRLRPRVAEVTEYAPVEPAPDRGLLSPQSANAAASAFGRLSESSLGRDAVESSFEQMTREMLQPMLRHWLDTHLPSIVERLVREEIERVARRGR